MMNFERLADGLGFTEGPVALADGSIWVTAIGSGMLYHIMPDGRIESQVHVGGGANGLTIDRDGVLYVAQNGGAWSEIKDRAAGIQRVINGKVDYIVTGVDAPNDLCFGPDGRLYFTDPRAAADPLDRDSALPGRLYACARDGSGLEMLHEGTRFINGLGFNPDGTRLFIAETCAPHRILSAPYHDGVVGEFEEFALLDGGFPDGLAFAADGTLWVAATMDHSIQIFGTDGQLLRKIDCGPDSLPTNICFSLADPAAVYVTASGLGAVLRAPCDVRGVALGG